MSAESVALLDALRAVLDAVRGEREARTSGEYVEGYIWSAEQAIDRLAELIDSDDAKEKEGRYS